MGYHSRAALPSQKAATEGVDISGYIEANREGMDGLCKSAESSKVWRGRRSIWPGVRK